MKNIHLYLKGTAMQIGLQILKNQNQPAYKSLLSEAQRYLENPSNTCRVHSTIKSKFIAFNKVGEEAEWLQQILEDIPL